MATVGKRESVVLHKGSELLGLHDGRHRGGRGPVAGPVEIEYGGTIRGRSRAYPCGMVFGAVAGTTVVGWR